MVAAPDPLLGIRQGVLRRLPDEADALWPEERLSVDDMIESFTINGAYANLLEHVTGSIEAGKSADLVVLSEDIRELDPDRIGEARVLLTIFRGRPVYTRSPFGDLADP